MTPEKPSLRLLLKIFLITFRIGLFTFGGGAAMMLLMQREFVDRQGWLDEETMTDVLAVSRSLPGVIAVNTSILASYRIAGLSGGLVAALGSTLPSFLVLVVVTHFYNLLAENPYFMGALRGVRGAVLALLTATVLRLRKQSIRDGWGYVIFFAVLAIALFFQSISMIFLIMGSLLAGVFLWLVVKKREGGNADA